MSAMEVVGVGVFGNDALCSNAMAVVLRKSTVMRHAVLMKDDFSSIRFSSVTFQVVFTVKRTSICFCAYASFF